MPAPRRAVWIALGLLAAWAPSLAGTLGLSWNGSQGAAGYRVHYGPAPGTYVASVDVGNTTQATLTSVANCTTSYFAVTAYNAAGESGFSEEVASWPRPAIQSASPASARQGQQVTLTLQGSNFRAGATIEIDNPRVVLANPTVTCNQIQVATEVEPTAPGVRPALVGTFDVIVTNPDDLTVTRSNGFQVRIEPARFDVNRSDTTTDGRIDGKDTVWLARLFGSSDGDAMYDPGFDFDGDGWVDGTDLAHLATGFGGCWNGSGWSPASCPAQP